MTHVEREVQKGMERHQLKSISKSNPDPIVSEY